MSETEFEHLIGLLVSLYIIIRGKHREGSVKVELSCTHANSLSFSLPFFLYGSSRKTICQDWVKVLRLVKKWVENSDWLIIRWFAWLRAQLREYLGHPWFWQRSFFPCKHDQLNLKFSEIMWENKSKSKQKGIYFPTYNFCLLLDLFSPKFLFENFKFNLSCLKERCQNQGCPRYYRSWARSHANQRREALHQLVSEMEGVK